ncbi:hypothetical protein CICLE_v10029742mg [Citrus x clementina]|uniref:Uncharacterized protein n=1 Tax=Citrus clementina TaxID=85681 RepID=V4SK08_CITCL|nr:hypothetical protein CICLE_v10029742mg [Citrus x clementina]
MSVCKGSCKFGYLTFCFETIFLQFNSQVTGIGLNRFSFMLKLVNVNRTKGSQIWYGTCMLLFFYLYWLDVEW